MGEVSRSVNPFKNEPHSYRFVTISSRKTVKQLIMQGSSEVGEMRLEIKHAKLQEISVDYFKMKELIAVSLPV